MPEPKTNSTAIAGSSPATCSVSWHAHRIEVLEEADTACRKIHEYLDTFTKQFGEDGVPGDDVVTRVKKLGAAMRKYDKRLDEICKAADRAKRIYERGSSYGELGDAVKLI